MKKLLFFTLISLISLTVLSQSCLPEGIIFTTQEQIDNFQTENPGCTEIEGDVFIDFSDGLDITNLNGLGVVTSIGGLLSIRGNEYGCNPDLVSLSGLEGLTFIGGDLFILHTALINLSGLENMTSIGGNLGIYSNDSLTSLTGLEGLTSIGGFLAIGGFDIVHGGWGNPLLTNLIGLHNLNTINGKLEVTGNECLTSLTGLDNIDATSIVDLSIYWNFSLSTCEVQSICDYLVTPNGSIGIVENATGCNTQQEVEEACETVSIEEVSFVGDISTSPNPFSTSTTITYELKQPERVSMSIYNHLGQIVHQTQEYQPQGKQQLKWNADRYADGIYYYRLQAGDAVANGKMVKVK